MIASFYSVFREDDGSLTALCRVDPSLDVFRGHFPGNPILPGVVMLEWLQQLLESQGMFPVVCSWKKVKFLSPVKPGTVLAFRISTTGYAEIHSGDTLCCFCRLERSASHD
ncbi:MAG: beta-hydroxyacyl-ACP dehydratase [Opitutales bacterium]|nr:beta-hydroxyacyl-ACP dehydratase [Opitutales bacterium]